jgi:hypothetical protein
MANPEHVELVKQGAEAIRRWREENPGVRLDLSGADLRGTILSDGDLHGADLRGATLFGTDLSGADLSRVDLSGTRLSGAHLVWIDQPPRDPALWLHRANLSGANLFGVSGAHRAFGLDEVQLTPYDAQDFESCVRHWPERWFDWGHLRGMGRLPLFGFSYTALILIPIVFYGLALYNEKVELVRTLAEQVIALPDHPWHRLAPLVLDRLHPRPIPSLSFLLFVSTILLAAASTLYMWCCPSRVKEFSRDQWCYQPGRSLLHYWPLAWKDRYIRLACAACYALGGAGAFWVLGTKVWHTALFILKHSTFPWPWR